MGFMHCISNRAIEISINKNLQAWKYSTWGVSGGSDFILVSNPENDSEVIRIENHIAASRDAGETSVPNEIVNQILSTFKFVGVPDGYSNNLINIKLKEGVDIGKPEILFPIEIRASINTISPLSSEVVIKSLKINSENLQRRFRISLKTNTDAVSFLQKVKDLDFVETAEYASLPQPPP